MVHEVKCKKKNKGKEKQSKQKLERLMETNVHKIKSVGEAGKH